MIEYDVISLIATIINTIGIGVLIYIVVKLVKKLSK
jgi:large-conductance mechanosensitive channel